MSVHIARTENRMGYRIWVVFSEHRILWGNPYESKVKVLVRWGKEYGNYSEYTQYQGILLWSELSPLIAEVQG